MRVLAKKGMIFVSAAVMAMTSLAGCGRINDSEIVATVGDSEITLGLANFYARYQQASFEEYYTSYQSYQQTQIYGSVMYESEMDWSAKQDEDGATLEETYKDDVMTSLQNLYIMEDHMKDYDIKLTDDELDAIDKAASAFVKANSEDVREKISAGKETVAEFLRLRTISAKVEEAVRAGVDSEVSDEEAAQKRIRYVSFETTKTDDSGQTSAMSDEEAAAVKEEASTFLEEAKANGSLENYASGTEKTSNTATYGSDFADDTSLTLPQEVYEAAEKLEENGFADIVETDSAIYVVQLESKFDEEATKTEKEAILEERQNKELTDTLEKWRDDTKIKVNKKVWAKVKMNDIQVNEKQEETAEDTSGDTTDDTAEDTSGDATDDTAEDTTDDTAEE